VFEFNDDVFTGRAEIAGYIEGRSGGRAPVMMQQSKGTGGCRFNPWPLEREAARVRR